MKSKAGSELSFSSLLIFKPRKLLRMHWALNAMSLKENHPSATFLVYLNPQMNLFPNPFIRRNWSLTCFCFTRKRICSLSKEPLWNKNCKFFSKPPFSRSWLKILSIEPSIQLILVHWLYTTTKRRPLRKTMSKSF